MYKLQLWQFNALFTWVRLVYQSIDEASEKNGR
jgi:hypothetical protein